MQSPADSQGRGLRILRRSLAIGALGIAPLLVYMLLGPKDGNPIGLGLLAVLAAAVSGIGILIGAGIAVVEFFNRPKR